MLMIVQGKILSNLLERHPLDLHCASRGVSNLQSLAHFDPVESEAR
jgi:hypothetical protein